ncbi:MAG: hypothetical protein DSY82_06390 [Flavobacteriia bacterium]|nr:MAG: hypothetical protein DSY82_06390 [Flavobacteriia bacterium]
MRKLAVLFVFVLFSSCATHTSFYDFYEKNHSDSDFSIGLNSSLLSNFLSDEDYEEIKPILRKAKHVRILVFSDNYDPMRKKFNKFIKRSDFENLISIKDDEDKVKIYTLENKDKIKEIVVDISTGEELVLLGLKTNISPDDLSKLLRDNDISFN